MDLDSLPVNKIIPWDFRMILTMISWMFAPCGFVCAMPEKRITVGWNTQQKRNLEKDTFDLIQILYPGIQSKKDKSIEEILEGPKDIMELLSLLFLSDREFEQILLILENKYDILLTKEERKEVEEMCTFGQGAFLAWKDYGLKKGREEGIAKGIQKGHKQGRKEGRKQGAYETLVQNITFLLESGTISDIQQAFSILHVKKELQPKILKILNLN